MADPQTTDAAPGQNVGITFCATLVDQWVRLGVRHAVVSPGSRSTPLALACAEHPSLRTDVHLDERSASFIALGIGKATGVPAILVTTSGTAATHLHAAVAEAHQAAVPILVCTADRPPEMQGVHAPQTIDQTNLYGKAVRWFVEPGPPTVEYRGSWRHLATDAFIAAGGTDPGRPPGPVHLNLAFREPLVGPRGELPDPIDVRLPSSARWGLPDEQLGALRRAMGGRRGVIVAGDRAARSVEEADRLLDLAAALGWPVFADHLSNVRLTHPSVVTSFDSLLRVDALADEFRPEFVLRIGGLLASRVTNEWLARSGATQVGLDRWGIIPDPDHVLSERFTVDIATVLAQMEGVEPAPSGWGPRWERAEHTARTAIIGSLSSEPVVVQAAHSAAAGGSLVVSSSMPIRDLEWYGPRCDATGGGRTAVYANRGANGIDGVISTAVGVALGSKLPTVCVIGDVAFLHDTNGLLGIGRRELPLLIMVIDNDGGGIFSFLPQASALDHERFEQLFGTPHGVHLGGLAAAHGLDWVMAYGGADLDAILRKWRDLPRPLVVVVRSGRARNADDHRSTNEAVRAAVLALGTEEAGGRGERAGGPATDG